MSLLISDPDLNWAQQIRKYFAQLNCVADVSSNGKDCQLKIYKNEIDYLLLDIDTTNHSGGEVLKFIRLNYPSVKVILTVSSLKRLEELKITKNDFLKMGVSTVLIKPYRIEKIVEIIEEQNFHNSWRDLVENTKLEDEQEIEIPDQELTRLDIKSMNLDNAAIFDCFTRIAKNKYMKIFNQGDIYDQARISKYLPNGGYVYFKTKDRSVYINFMNDFINQVAAKDQFPTHKKVSFAKNLTEKYIEEVHTKGLHPQLMEEGKKVCENMYEIIMASKDLSVLMRDYQEVNDDDLTHTFLTSFFAVMIAKNLKWKSSRTIEAIALGSLLHDIGKLKLDKKIRDKSRHELTQAEFLQYQKHPEYGVSLLQKWEGINESVLQIIYQHHEFMGGDGFPNKLSGSKIYPLAKVVCLADHFSHEMLKKKLNPISTLKELISNKAEVFRFDPLIVKALITCFIKTDEK